MASGEADVYLLLLLDDADNLPRQEGQFIVALGFILVQHLLLPNSNELATGWLSSGQEPTYLGTRSAVCRGRGRGRSRGRLRLARL